MASVSFQDVAKIYDDGTKAVTDLTLEVEDGEFMVLVGPSGCGKTTALRMIAGLEEVSEGDLLIGDEVVNTIEPRKRDVAMVFQNYALYPHLSVFENIAFPLRSRKLGTEEIRTRVNRAASLLGLEEHLKRRPKNLSGGQRQRVAMGRALVRQPKVFLMDEPLSNLDAKLRVQMRVEICRLQRELGVTTVYVTHDQVEAMTMGNRIAIMRKGVLQQVGPPQNLYDYPANLFVATFIGSPAMNLFRARVVPDERGGLSCVLAASEAIPIPHEAMPALASYAGRDVALGVRPEDFTDAAYADPAQPRLSADVTLVEALGPERLVYLTIDASPVVTTELLEIARDTDASTLEALAHDSDVKKASLVARYDARSDVRVGTPVQVAVNASRLHFFDLDDGRTIR
jgi:multiple sugar transport system ATP-binding protein